MSLIFFPIIVPIFALIFVWFLHAQAKKNKKTAYDSRLVYNLAVASCALLAVALCYLFAGLSWLVGLGFIACFASYLLPNIPDTFTTYFLAIIGTMILGSLLFPLSSQFVLLPLILGSVFLLALIVGSLALSPSKGFWATIILAIVGFLLVISKLMLGQAVVINNLYFPALIGLIAVLLLSSLYSIISAGLASLILLFVYFEQVLTHGVSIYSLDYVRVFIGVLLGGVVSSLFVLSANASKKRKIFLPGLVIILAPILVGFILGAQVLLGLLAGVIATGVFTAITTKTSKINPLIKGVGIVALLILGFLV